MFFFRWVASKTTNQKASLCTKKQKDLSYVYIYIYMYIYIYQKVVMPLGIWFPQPWEPYSWEIPTGVSRWFCFFLRPKGPLCFHVVFFHCLHVFCCVGLAKFNCYAVGNFLSDICFWMAPSNGLESHFIKKIIKSPKLLLKTPPFKEKKNKRLLLRESIAHCPLPQRLGARWKCPSDGGRRRPA